MRLVQRDELLDHERLQCPWCGSVLMVEDPDDFEDGSIMYREEDHVMTCPVCDNDMRVHVIWVPTYPYGAKREEA